MLKPGRRLCISDVVTATPLSEEVRRDLAALRVLGWGIRGERVALLGRSGGVCAGADRAQGGGPSVHQGVGTRPTTPRRGGVRIDRGSETLKTFPQSRFQLSALSLCFCDSIVKKHCEN